MDIALSLAEFALLGELIQQSGVNPDEAELCKALGIFYLGHNGLPLKDFKQMNDVVCHLGFNVEVELDVTIVKARR